MNKKYIHYGAKKFEIEKFSKVSNRPLPMTKPLGGFWASPIDAVYGWKQWNAHNNLKECNKENAFIFKLNKHANISHIYLVEDLEKLPRNLFKDKQFVSTWYCIDFERCMEDGIDAIELHLTGEKGQSLYYQLYGWDCDSIIIMNPQIIEEA